MSPRFTSLSVVAMVALGLGCPKAPPPPPPVVDAKSQREQLRVETESVVKEARAVMKARDEALWNHWTNGTPIDLAQVWKGHDALLSRPTVELLGRAQKEGVGDSLVRTFIISEAVSRAIADSDATVANLEASLTFQVDGKEQPLRELERLLMQERTAAKRAAMWTEALKPAARLDEALARRDTAAETALQTLGLSHETWAAELRGTDLDLAAQWADRFLKLTDARWAERLKRWQDRELKSAPALPDVLLMRRSPTGLDAAFPKAREGERVTTVMQGLGLYGVSGLTLELSDQPKKLPLPLTVALAGDDVRVSYRPSGGAHDQQAMLEETGRALATRFASGAPKGVEATGVLFASLLNDPLWLADQGVSAALATAQLESANDARLMLLRRTSAMLLSKSVDAPDDDAAKAAYATQVGRALGVAVTPADAVRRRIESAELSGEIETLRAHTTAEALRAMLGERWWQNAEAGTQLKAYWKSGTLPEATQAKATNGEALLQSLGVSTTGGTGLDGGT